jgi:hypothetical protein
VRLSVNVITGSPSRYYRAGEEIPDDAQIPETLRKFELRDDAEGGARKPSTLARSPKHAAKLRKQSSR